MSSFCKNSMTTGRTAPGNFQIFTYFRQKTPMVIEIKKTMSKAEMKQALTHAQGRKTLDAKRFVGTVKWLEDPIAYQKRMRDEW